jgi:hypothetical protein
MKLTHLMLKHILFLAYILLAALILTSCNGPSYYEVKVNDSRIKVLDPQDRHFKLFDSVCIRQIASPNNTSEWVICTGTEWVNTFTQLDTNAIAQYKLGRIVYVY